MRHSRVRAAAVAALILVSACGSQPRSAPAQHTTACPGRAPWLVLPSAPAAPAGLVPAGPAAAAVCQYAIGIPAGQTAGMPRLLTMTGTAAAGLAAVLDSGWPVTSSALRCDRPARLDPFAQEIILGYPDGRTRTVTVAFSDCNLGLAAVGGRTTQLPLRTEADLFAFTSITTLRPGSAAVPDLIGRSAAAAVARAHRHHFSVSIDGAVIDTAVPAGTVVFQSLPAGARGSGPGGGVDVFIATSRAPECTAGQLALSFLGGGASAGSDFGSLLVRDTSARPCTLPGPLTVTGLGHDGRPDTDTRADPVRGVAVLTPGAGPLGWRPHRVLTGTRPGELTGAIQLMSEYRDGPPSVDHGSCAPLWVVPVTWRVTLPDGSAVTAANVDRAGPGRLVGSGGFVTCQGKLGVVGPATVASP